MSLFSISSVPLSSGGLIQKPEGTFIRSFMSPDLKAIPSQKSPGCVSILRSISFRGDGSPSEMVLHMFIPSRVVESLS